MIFRKTLQYFVLSCTMLTFTFSGDVIENSEYSLIVFEGSDWCLNCIRFEEEVLSDSAFISFAEDQNIKIERVDFPQRKKLAKQIRDRNASIAEKYSFDGVYPTIILANEHSDEAVKLNYKRENPLEFVRLLKSRLPDLQ